MRVGDHAEIIPDARTFELSPQSVELHLVLLLQRVQIERRVRRVRRVWWVRWVRWVWRARSGVVAAVGVAAAERLWTGCRLGGRRLRRGCGGCGGCRPRESRPPSGSARAASSGPRSGSACDRAPCGPAPWRKWPPSPQSVASPPRRRPEGECGQVKRAESSAEKRRGEAGAKARAGVVRRACSVTKPSHIRSKTSEARPTPASARKFWDSSFMRAARAISCSR